MKKRVTIPSTILSILIGLLIAVAGSDGSETYNGMSLFIICASVSFVLHWIIFIPSFAFQTEHYFDLTGSISYLSAVALAFYLNPSVDPRDLNRFTHSGLGRSFRVFPVHESQARW